MTTPARGPGLLERIAFYGASRGVTEALLAARGLLIAAVLGPAAFGGWALLRLSGRYTALANFGVFRGLEFELGAGTATAEERRRSAASALGFVLVVFGLLALALVGASFLVADPAHRLVLRALAGLSLLEEIYIYGLVCLRMRGALRHYAAVEIVHAALQVACTVGMAHRWGLPGGVAGLMLATSIAAVLALRGAPALVPALDRAALRQLLRVGLPIVATMALNSLLSSGDRWVVAAFGGTMLLGYYSFAASVSGLAATGAWVIRTVIFRDVYGEARTLGAAAAVRAHLARVVRPYGTLVPALFGAGAVLVGPAVALVVPRYAAAADAARIFLLAGGIAGLGTLCSVGVVAARRQQALPALSAGALTVNLLVSTAALATGADLAVVALGGLLAQTLMVAGVLRLSLRAAGLETGPQAYARFLGPFVWCSLAVAAATRLSPGVTPGAVGLALAAYALLVLPLLPHCRREWRTIRAPAPSVMPA